MSINRNLQTFSEAYRIYISLLFQYIIKFKFLVKLKKFTVTLASAEFSVKHISSLWWARAMHSVAECTSPWVLTREAVMVKESTLILISTLDFSPLSLMECHPMVNNPLCLSVHVPVITQKCKGTVWCRKSTGLKVRRADSKPSSSTNYLTLEKPLHLSEHLIYLL